MTFSEKLIILRKRRGMSQEQLAEKLDISRQTVSKWESQQALPDASKIVLIAEIFSISTDLLLKDECEIADEEVAAVAKTVGKEKQTEKMVCAMCGGENLVGSDFCIHCGKNFF